ncbi:MAG: electron transfer flavoprotein subunit alpha/FixB family protein [Thermincolia bacterium]
MIWVVAEQRDGALRKITFEMLSKGRRLADEKGLQLGSVLMGGPGVAGLAGELGFYGADKVYLVENPLLEYYTTDAYTLALTKLIKEHQPEVVLLGNTTNGRDLAPRVAQHLGTGLATDVTGIELEGGQLVFIRPVYAGKALAKVTVPEAIPVMATVRPNVLDLEQPDTGRQAQVVNVDAGVTQQDIRTLVKEVIKQAGGRVELTEANIIVSGGRGLKGSEGFVVLELLADTLGGAVGSSRAAVDAGWRNHQYQVGQTGKVVSPNLYIACGISGAIQHLAGMSSSKCIVAINKDPEANIFKIADYGIVGDLFEVVPLLNEEFKKLLATA